MNASPLDCHYLTQDERQLPAGIDWLSPREREALARLPLAAPRRDWLLGRWTAKRAIAAQSMPGAQPIPLPLIEILTAPDGVPEVFVGAVAAPHRIALGQRAGRALCVLTARDNAIGCDLELLERHEDARAEDLFTTSELAFVGATYGAERDRLVAVIRGAKTSALRMLREGLRIATRCAEVTLQGEPEGDGWAALVVECPGQGCLLPGWWRTLDDLVLTVVTAGASAPPRAVALSPGAPSGRASGPVRRRPRRTAQRDVAGTGEPR